MRDRLEGAARVALKGLAVALDPLFGRSLGPRILIYHQVGVCLGREMEVSTGTFVEQLDWLQKAGEIVDIATAIERRNEAGADKLFVLTFDDGFEDVYRNAFPLMKERSAPFTLYLTTSPIETGQPLDSRFPDAMPLDWHQVVEMAETGLATIGAHTHTHSDLRLLTPDQIEDELDTSNRLISDRTGISPKHFTYPWGWWSRSADRIVRQHYESSTAGGAVRTVSDGEPHLMVRRPVQRSDSLVFFRRRLNHGLRLEEEVRRIRSRRP